MPRVATRHAGKNETTDVIVIGTGISGALMADALLRSGLRVTAVDRRSLFQGSTPASTCLLQFEIDTPLLHIVRKIGFQRASRAWLRSAQAMRSLTERISDLSLRCDFREQSTIYLPGKLLDETGLYEEAALRRRIGLRSSFLNRRQLQERFGIDKAGAIMSLGNGEADPVKLVAGLWRRFIERQGQIIIPFDAAEIEESRSSVAIHSLAGRRITAKHAVFCTGYELPKWIRPKGYSVASTWAIATKSQPNRLWPESALIWEADDPYLYLRTTRDGRVIAGGADEPFADEARRDRLTALKAKRIAGKAARIFPAIDFEPEFTWTGNFGVSETGLPRIGLVPRHRRTYMAMGFGGNGFTFSMLAAEIICRAINGLRDPDADIFEF